MSEHCHICKRKYDFVYSVPDEVWEKISPVPVDGFKSGGLLCIECANTRADENGIILFWSAGVNGYPDADLRERLAKVQSELEKSDTGWADCRIKLHNAYAELGKEGE